MSWASRRRALYGLGVGTFFLVLVGGPLAYWYFSVPPSCTDGIQNQEETSVDRGGPCPLLDPNSLTTPAVLWARSFRIREGLYSALAYIQNPNANAGLRAVSYRFGLYDENNVIVAERTGVTYIMPGTITPIFEGAIDTGNRVVAHTYFDFTSGFVWERLMDTSGVLSIYNTQVADLTTAPRITTMVQNTSVAPVRDMVFVAILYDPAGNAFAASQTALLELDAGATRQIVFTWPTPFTKTVGRVQIVPLTAPREAPGA